MVTDMLTLYQYRLFENLQELALLICGKEAPLSFDFSSSSILFEAFPHVNLSIDAITQSCNKKLPRYSSRFKDPLAIGQDFFAQRLEVFEQYFVFPPPRVAVAHLLPLRKYKASEDQLCRSSSFSLC